MGGLLLCRHHQRKVRTPAVLVHSLPTRGKNQRRLLEQRGAWSNRLSDHEAAAARTLSVLLD